MAPGKFEWNFWYLIFQIFSVIDGWGISCELALRWMSLDLTYDKSTLVQVMAWCHQATSHYLSQCWPRSLSPYGVIGPLWNFETKFSQLTIEVQPFWSYTACTIFLLYVCTYNCFIFMHEFSSSHLISVHKRKTMNSEFLCYVSPMMCWSSSYAHQSR